MAENKEGQEKTEPASGKKLSESRDKGQVSKSIDVTTSAALLFGTLLVYFTGAGTVGSIKDLLERILIHSNEFVFTDLTIQAYSLGFILYISKLVLPILMGISAIILIAEISQVGLHFATKKFTEGLNLAMIFNPFSGLKRMLFSSRSMVELLKSLMKLIILGSVVYTVLMKYSDEAILLMERPINEIGAFIGKVSLELILKVGALYILIAAGDYFYQKYKFKDDMKMTKQEVKEEGKQSEGNPMIKSKIRSIMRGRLRKLMLAKMSQADVVITNPTHYAIALKYQPKQDNAPIVIAKGVDFLAFRIRELAKEYDIPIVEEPPLARALYYSVEINESIPENLFKAVAQILAYVFRLKKKDVMSNINNN